MSWILMKCLRNVVYVVRMLCVCCVYVEGHPTCYMIRMSRHMPAPVMLGTPAQI